MKISLKRVFAIVMIVIMVFASVPVVRLDVAAEATDNEIMEFNGHYYKVFKNTTIGWHDAKTACEKVGGHLVTITSAKENDFVYSLICKSGVQCWLGATDEKKEGTWKWVTGEKWNYQDAYFDNCAGIQHYLVMNYQGSKQWDDQSEKYNSNNGQYCKTTGYVCEWDKEPNTKGTFERGRDNNNFYHWDEFDISSGFFGILTYGIGYKFSNKLTCGLSAIDSAKIRLAACTRPWDGACFGISATMGLLFENYISIKDLTYKNVNSYYAIGKPCYDKQFRDNIHYYYLASSIGKINEASMATSVTVNETELANLNNKTSGYDSNAQFMKKLVDLLLAGKIALICYTGGDGGHAILATGYEYSGETNEHRIQLYDMNSVAPDSKKGYFDELVISSDYSKFGFFSNDDKDKPYFSSESLRKMVLYTFDEIQKVAYRESENSVLNAKKALVLQGASDNCATIEFNINKPITIVNQKGEKLSYDGKKLSGNMPVYELNFVGEGELTKYSIKTDNTEYFEVSGTDDKFSFEAQNSERYLMLNGDSNAKATVSFTDGITFSGDDYAFEAYMTTDEDVIDGQRGLISVCATADSDVSLNAKGDTVKVTADKDLENITTATYTGLVKQENKINTATDKLEVVAEKETEHKLGDYIVTREATYTNSGTKAKICATCGAEVDEKVIPQKTLGTTSKITATKTKTSVTLTWNKVAGADGYRVYRKTSSGWLTLGHTTRLTYTENSLKANTKYTYAVKAYVLDGATKVFAPKYKTLDVTTSKATLGTTSKITATKTTSSVTLKWNKVTGATGYRVYQKTASGWKTLANTTKLTYTVKSLKAGTKYTFAIRAYVTKSGKMTLAPKYKTLDVTTTSSSAKPAQVKNLKATPTATTVKLTWSKVSGVKGYYVFSYNSKTKKYTSLGKTTGTSYTVKNCKTNTAYQYAVQAYKVSGKKTIYGKVSSVVNVTTLLATPTVKISSTKATKSKLTSGKT